MTDAAARQWSNWLILDFDPHAPINRWTHIRKLALLLEIDHGSISEKEACSIHAISCDEIAEWRRRIEAYGVDAIKSTKQPSRSSERRS